jgi:hypothetical protein
MRRSLRNPHPESIEFAEQGNEGWSRGLLDENAGALVGKRAGKAVSIPLWDSNSAV